MLDARDVCTSAAAHSLHYDSQTAQHKSCAPAASFLARSEEVGGGRDEAPVDGSGGSD